MALALERIDASAERFRLAAEGLPAVQARIFWDLAACSVALRSEIEAAPEMITPCRKLIFFYLPRMSELSRDWVRLTTADPFAPSPPDLTEFHSYLAILEAATASCRNRRIDALTQTFDAFHLQLERLDR